MRTQDQYVIDGRLDVEAIERDGHSQGDWCDVCDEQSPCAILHAAEFVTELRERRRPR